MMAKQVKSKNPRRGMAAPGEIQSQLRAILDTAVEGIIGIDERGTVETFNRAAQRMFGYQADEVIGRNISMLMPEPYRAEHDRYVANYLRTGWAKIIGIGREAVGRRKDGHTFPIDLAVSEVRAGGRRTFTGIIRDITERKRLEKEVLEVSEREQQRIGKDLHDGVCQELAGIAFLVQSIQQRLQAGGSVHPTEASQVTKLLEQAVRHARQLSHGLYPVDPQPNGLAVALAQLAATTTDMFHVACDFRRDGDVELYNPSAATHLYRIAQEAVRDAIRHGRASRITIELRQRGGAIELSVCDNGIGLNDNGRLRDDMVMNMIQHRAKVVGASLQIRPGRGGGVRVAAFLPLDSLPLEHNR